MKYKLKDLAVIKRGASPRPINEYVSEKGYPWLKISDFSLNDKFVYKTKEFIIEAGLKKTRYVKSGTLIVTNSATPGIPIFLMKDMCLHDGFLYFESISPKIDKEYLYYFILNNRSKLIKLGNGSVFVNLKKEILENYEIELPSIDVQHKIARYLSAIDEKIKLNNEINDNLLKQAIEIYSDLIKDKDKNGCIGDYCTIKSGFAFKSNWWTDNGVKVVKIGSINQDNLDLNSCSYVSSENAVRAKEFIVKGGDLLIAMTGATIGKFAMVPSLNEGIYVNQRVGKFFLGDNPISRLPYIYCTLKQPDIYSEIINRGQGSAQPNISGGDIMSIPCVILSKEDIDDFNQKCKPIFSLMIDRQKENADLSDLRDSLLPKLMSGEIDVDSIEL